MFLKFGFNSINIDGVIDQNVESVTIKDLRNSLQDNSPTDSLYPSEQWDMEWDTEGENLVPTEHQYSLDDLYWCDDYDNVLKNEYGR